MSKSLKSKNKRPTISDLEEKCKAQGKLLNPVTRRCNKIKKSKASRRSVTKSKGLSSISELEKKCKAQGKLLNPVTLRCNKIKKSKVTSKASRKRLSPVSKATGRSAGYVNIDARLVPFLARSVPGGKFQLGDKVRIFDDAKGRFISYNGLKREKFIGEHGIIVGYHFVKGSFSKYLVEFKDGTIEEFHSHFIGKN